jgi:hypothetical protein
MAALSSATSLALGAESDETAAPNKSAVVKNLANQDKIPSAYGFVVPGKFTN